MGQVVVVGLDIAKSVFQVHGVDRDAEVVVRRRLRRSRVLPFFATAVDLAMPLEAGSCSPTRPLLWRACSGDL
jgi:transposase